MALNNIATSCPCKRLGCERHGDCAACMDHHRNSKRYPLAACQRLEAKKQPKEAEKQIRRNHIMTWNEMFARDHMPTMEQVGEYIDSPLWDSLNRALLEDFQAKPKLEYSGCSMPGWNIKYKKKGKSLCTLYPFPHNFQALVIANECNQPDIDFFIETCCDKIIELYRNTKYFNGGKWLFIEIDSQAVLDDTIKLISFRNS